MDEELPQHNEIETDKSLKKIAVISGAVPSIIALFAILFCFALLQENHRLQVNRDCTRRIDLYVADIRDDLNAQGWDALVTRAENSPRTDVQEIARQMRLKIDALKSSRDMRQDAVKLCEVDPDFQPR
jgi:hypothetical protein